VKMDRCSMAHALEARSPFLDRELIEYVFALPDERKLRGRAGLLPVLPAPRWATGGCRWGMPGGALPRALW
jgi:hypothetical protein